MTVLVSGASGFVGLNLTEALLARGDDVVMFQLDTPPDAALARLKALPGRLAVEHGDVGDTEGFTACLRRHRIDRLFPLAAVTSGPVREREEPERVLQVNLLGFVSQLRAARDAGVRRIIAPSSTAIYGESVYGPGPLAESGTAPVPISLYGITKYALERMALRLSELWDLDVVAVRIGAVFGPFERDTGVRDSLSPFWQIAQLARAGTAVVLPADLQPYGWIYSRDAASGLLHLLDMPTPSHRLFNLGSDENWDGVLVAWCRALHSVYPGLVWRQSRDLAEINVHLTDTRPRAPMSIERLRQTGWQPAFPPAAALADYAAWLGANDPV